MRDIKYESENLQTRNDRLRYETRRSRSFYYHRASRQYEIKVTDVRVKSSFNCFVRALRDIDLLKVRKIDHVITRKIARLHDSVTSSIVPCVSYDISASEMNPRAKYRVASVAEARSS